MIIMEDHTGEAISYNASILAAAALGSRIAKITKNREKVGILLPTCAPAMIAFFALQAVGRVAVILNFQNTASDLETACASCGIKTILTSKQFIKVAHLEKIITQLEDSVAVVYLEDLRLSLTIADKIAAAARSHLPLEIFGRSKPDDIAVILFTSGTTGAPKGVALSHANLLANIAQCRAHIQFDENWIFFNALPVFHAFGLTGGALLPILSGMKAVLHPSPLDHERIPNAIESTHANVLISTDTFARLYARSANDKALQGLRYVVLGGERVHDNTRQLFSEKSAALVLEGYGATECAPIIAVNRPGANMPGSVGELLPGMEARFMSVEGQQNAGRLFVRGPNVMLGYLDPDQAGRINPVPDGWFDTGDLAQVDQNGFLTITGRCKRFAMVGGETVSLDAVEAAARALWPSGNHAAISIPRADNTEEIVLVTDRTNAARTDLVTAARKNDISRLTIPHRVICIPALPLLATGKPDYMAAQRIAGHEHCEPSSPIDAADAPIS